jgi:predicted TIM-barrel fold metal-dependent hydrolase
MKRLAFWLVLAFTVVACNRQRAAPVTGPFSGQEWHEFAALNPIDAHAHVFVSDPAFYAMLNKLNLHIVDILVVDDTNQSRSSLSRESQRAWEFVDGSNGRVSVCTTFDAYKFNQPTFAQEAIRQINQEFDRGAIAVKIWKNIGMELKDANGNYLLPDNPIFDPIYKDIAAHDKTLIAHMADPSSLWQPPNPESSDYPYYQQNPQWYMYSKAHRASREQILQARDHLIERNPNLRVVGAHLGSLEDNFDLLGQHFDRYPNFAVDLAGRMPYLMSRPRENMISFITKHQDRLIYGTDIEFGFGEKEPSTNWEDTYAKHWRYLATNDTLNYRGHRVQGLALPHSILRKLYHDNALQWFPGILSKPH